MAALGAGREAIDDDCTSCAPVPSSYATHDGVVSNNCANAPAPPRNSSGSSSSCTLGVRGHARRRPGSVIPHAVIASSKEGGCPVSVREYSGDARLARTVNCASAHAAAQLVSTDTREIGRGGGGLAREDTRCRHAQPHALLRCAKLHSPVSVFACVCSRVFVFVCVCDEETLASDFGLHPREGCPPSIILDRTSCWEGVRQSGRLQLTCVCPYTCASWASRRRDRQQLSLIGLWPKPLNHDVLDLKRTHQ